MRAETAEVRRELELAKAEVKTMLVISDDDGNCVGYSGYDGDNDLMTEKVLALMMMARMGKMT